MIMTLHWHSKRNGSKSHGSQPLSSLLRRSSMPPLTRQETRTSVFSWWSDRNPLLKGPTINLHAVAKPLMKFMYHRQALDFIRKNEDSPISATTLEIYASYFPWDYVSWGTKAAILLELAERRSTSEIDAQAVVDSPVFYYIGEILASPDPLARGLACRLLSRLALYECTIPPILKMGGCERLVALLDDQDDEVVWWATLALTGIARCLDGAQAMVGAKVQDHILKLLQSWPWSPEVAEWTCLLAGKLAGHKPTVPAILESNLLKQLMLLLRRCPAEAIIALRAISQWPDGVAALADVGVPTHLNQVWTGENPLDLWRLHKFLEDIAQ